MTELAYSGFEWAAALFTLAGSFFFLAGAIAIFRLPDFYCRMHGPTKAVTLGLMLVGTGALLRSIEGASAHWPKDLILVIFLFITAPVSAQLLMRAACARREVQTGTARGLPPLQDVEHVEETGELVKALVHEKYKNSSPD